MKLGHFKKAVCHNRKLIGLIKVVLTCYLLIFISSYLTSDTTAYFTTSLQTSGTIKVGTWEEESDETVIAFDEIEEQTVTSWPTPIEIFVINDGKDKITESMRYVVYFSESDVPKNQMKQVESGEKLGSLEVGKSAELTFAANEPGFYKFAILSDSNQEIIVSNSIEVSYIDEEYNHDEAEDEAF